VLAAGWIHSERILSNLKSVAREAKDVEVRRNAVISLGRFDSWILEGGELEKLKDVFAVLETSMADYTVDDRGDVGSWIRETAMESAACIIEKLPLKTLLGSNDGSGIVGVVQAIVRQCLEKIDRTRFAAAQALDRICRRVGELECGKNGENDDCNKSVLAVFEAIISAFQFDATLPKDEFERKEMLKDRFKDSDTRREILIVMGISS